MVAPEWQTHDSKPGDEVVKRLDSDCVVYLRTRVEVDPNNFSFVFGVADLMEHEIAYNRVEIAVIKRQRYTALAFWNFTRSRTPSI